MKRNMEIRGVDIHPSALFGTDPETGPHKITEIVELAAKHNLNFLRPFVVGTHCDASYDSRIVPVKLFKGWDPLEILLKEAHSEGLEVHPFVCVVPKGTGDTRKPGNLGPTLKVHPEWAMVNKEGQPIGWGNPAHPRFREHVVSIVMELVENYDVDGVSFDYARYPGTNVGYSDHNRNKFKEKYGVDPMEIAEETSLHEEWSRWRIEQLAQLMREIRDVIKDVKPEIMLSAYVWTTRDPRICLRDWEEWLREGYLDAINPSGYVYDFDGYMNRCRETIKAARKANPRAPVFINIGVHTSHGRLRDAAQVIRWTRGARAAGSDGMNFFTMRALLPYLDGVSRVVFQEKVKVLHSCNVVGEA